VTSAGQERSFLLHIPPGYQPGVALPLVLNLHGLGSSAAEQARLSGMSDLADRQDFVVVYPQGRGAPAAWYIGTGLQATEDVRYLRDLIDFLLARMSIDAGRIYATGYSNGGGMANRLGCALSDRLAAIASVSGAYLQHGSCPPGRPLPVLAFHGTADAIVPYGGDSILPAVHDWAEAWAARNGCDEAPAVENLEGGTAVETWSGCQAGARVVLYTIDGGGHTWPGSGLARLQNAAAPPLPATELIWNFFESQQP
jgi:polyhydroxybutyrate depolymerase